MCNKAYLLYRGKIPLSDVIKFDIVNIPLDFRNFIGLTFDVYYGYILDNGEIRYNAYRIKIIEP